MRSSSASRWRDRLSPVRPERLGELADATQVDSWILVSDSTITLKTSQIETGNRITTTLQVLAEEMSADMSQMRYGMFSKASLDIVDTWVAVSSGGEGGSNAMSGTGPKIRNVGAIVYNSLLTMASANLGVPVGSLTVKGGVVSGGGKTVSYGNSSAASSST